MTRIFLISALFGLLLTGQDARGEEAGPIPEQVSLNHRACREVVELSAKYGVEGLTAQTGATFVTRKVLADRLIAILGKVAEKTAREGEGALPQEDLKRLATLKQDLLPELEAEEGYLQRRETIDRLLAPHEETQPPFIVKYGVNGFFRGEGAGNFRLTDFSYDPGHGEGRFLYRAKPYLYWHPTDYLDIHLEGQGSGYSGGNQQLNRVSLYQGFVEAKIPETGTAALRAGRQEFTYGSAFILGNDPFVKGRSFDGGRLRLKPAESHVIDFLAGDYATPFAQGVTGTLTGVYTTCAFGKEGAVEVYLLRDTISANHQGGEYLLTSGLRWTAEFEPFSFEFEPVYQTGRAANPAGRENERIDAFGGHIDLSAEIRLSGYHSHLFTSFAYGSGSREGALGTTTRHEFRTPLNDSSLMGDMKVIGDLSGFTVGGHHASGLQVCTLGWGIDVTPAVNITATGRLFRANDVADGFSRTVGTEVDLTLTWALGDDLSLLVGYDRFFTGGFFRDATGSGKEIDYGYLMLQFDLSRKKLSSPKQPA